MHQLIAQLSVLPYSTFMNRNAVSWLSGHLVKHFRKSDKWGLEPPEHCTTVYSLQSVALYCSCTVDSCIVEVIHVVQ